MGVGVVADDADGGSAGTSSGPLVGGIDADECRVVLDRGIPVLHGDGFVDISVLCQCMCRGRD